MSLFPISPSPRKSCALKSNSPFVLSLKKLSDINSPFGSPKFNDLYHTPLREALSPKGVTSKLFSEQQIREAMAIFDEHKLYEKEASPWGLISAKKRLRPESESIKINNRSKKVTKFTKTGNTLAEVISSNKKPSSNFSEGEYSEYNSESYKEENSESIYDSPEFEVNSYCKHCGGKFKTAQALGGHMSRKHPGKSHDYNHKKEVRRSREVERMKLLLAKKLFYKELGYDYDKLKRMKDGKTRLKALMNRAKIKKLKSEITKKQLDDFIRRNTKAPKQ